MQAELMSNRLEIAKDLTFWLPIGSERLVRCGKRIGVVMAKGFYSLVQYCPNRFRAEAVNIGLVLVCVEPHDVRVRITDRFDRVCKLFSMEESELNDLRFSSVSLQSRIESSRDQFVSADDLQSFAAARANDIRMTEPRLAKLTDTDQDFDRLYADLVDAEDT